MIVMFFFLFDPIHSPDCVNCTKVDKFFNFGESFPIARRLG